MLAFPCLFFFVLPKASDCHFQSWNANKQKLPPWEAETKHRDFISVWLGESFTLQIIQVIYNSRKALSGKPLKPTLKPPESPESNLVMAEQIGMSQQES